MISSRANPTHPSATSAPPDPEPTQPLLPESQPLGAPVLAAIDVGTNSLHMVVVRINPRIPSFSIISREKATVRLGEYCNKTGALTAAAMERALEALDRFCRIADAFQVQSIVAVATSAVREAPNGLEFLKRIEQELGLRIELISGQEEARRIYLGVLSAMEFHNRLHVVVDIGGGSTELILGDGQEPEFLRSVKVGAVRLTQAFLHTDPPTSAELQALRQHIRGMLEAPIEQIKRIFELRAHQGSLTLVGTSGTIETLAQLDARRRLGSPPSRMQGYEFTLEALRSYSKEFRALTIAERQKLPGLGEKRGEIILAGTMILEEVMSLLGIEQIQFCERALREGLIVDWMISQGLIEDRLRYHSSVRRRSILKLAEKYQVELPYAERVAEFSLSLFDQTRGLLHRWGSRERALLWAAAMLHNCGHFISHAAHHKHSYYLIRHGELLGFNEEEVELIANLARYHRKSPPKKKHENFQRLTDERDRQIVMELSPLLRIACALDRRRLQAIQSLHCRFQLLGEAPRQMELILDPKHPNDDCALELWSLKTKKEVFEQQFKLEVIPKLSTQAEQTLDPFGAVI
ncbi:Ppx/GppA phosphatase family protein [Thermostichus vulcanus]|uniref:Ppx/GppA family phosphatase n=1 Tax=Thermostichus vulcanus str. 'Rupite' TaxID=2813851 RepID=A0ABT0C897_THEVL|nr:Ppx/GppA phosphatase family protein [Thermostichus vulcanus]MCJ2542012.1 Ppx/GppA family phosphatase [Thermostichus vulcanus str. 'Rupite']